jgi:hypothetical protein
MGPKSQRTLSTASYVPRLHISRENVIGANLLAADPLRGTRLIFFVACGKRAHDQCVHTRSVLGSSACGY